MNKIHNIKMEEFRQLKKEIRGEVERLTKNGLCVMRSHPRRINREREVPR